jgi:signal transduction histidine kinase
MSPLRSVRGRTAAVLAALMLSVAALALIVVHQALQPPAPSPWEALISSMLSDPFFSGASPLADPSTMSSGPLDALGGDGPVLVAAWLILVPITIRLAWLIAGRVTRPIVAVAEAAETAGPANLHGRLPSTRQPAEVGRLHEAFNGLMDRFERHELERRRLIDDTAHEVRNPLAAMRTSLEVALDDAADPGDLRAAAAVAQRAGERIARSIDGLQAGAHDHAGSSARTVLDLADIVHELADDHRPVAARRGVEIRVLAAPGIHVVGDRDGLRRALENLLVNAIRFAPPGSPVIVGAGATPGWRWMGVRDLGPGIAPADQPLVFARGWRGGPEAGDGSGIGLALVRQIAEAHHGTVRLSSLPRAGSSFVVWLPVVETDGSQATRVDAQVDPLWWTPMVVPQAEGRQAEGPQAVGPQAVGPQAEGPRAREPRVAHREATPAF